MSINKILLIAALFLAVAIIVLRNTEFPSGRYELVNGYALVNLFGTTYIIVDSEDKIIIEPRVISHEIEIYGNIVVGYRQRAPEFTEINPNLEGLFLLNTRTGEKKIGLTSIQLCQMLMELKIDRRVCK